MSMNGFNTGQDVTLVLTDPNTGNVLSTVTVINFESKPINETKRIDPLDGYSVPLIFYTGWEGSLEIERTGDELDIYWATLEANYYLGLNQTGITINQTIRNPNGTTSQWQYINTILQLTDAGTWSRTNSVTQKFNFMCSAKEPV
jgi:hypothetical protein